MSQCMCKILFLSKFIIVLKNSFSRCYHPSNLSDSFIVYSIGRLLHYFPRILYTFRNMECGLKIREALEQLTFYKASEFHNPEKNSVQLVMLNVCTKHDPNDEINLKTQTICIYKTFSHQIKSLPITTSYKYGIDSTTAYPIKP